jgi:hypothetical protein
MTYLPTAPRVDHHVGLTRIHVPADVLVDAVTTIVATAVADDQVQLLVDLADAARAAEDAVANGSHTEQRLALRDLQEAQHAVMSELLGSQPVTIDLSGTQAVEHAGRVYVEALADATRRAAQDPTAPYTAWAAAEDTRAVQP